MRWGITVIPNLNYREILEIEQILPLRSLRLRRRNLEIAFFEFDSTYLEQDWLGNAREPQGTFIPARKEQPKTKRILDNIDPSIYIGHHT
jgi:hypothetical protein